MSDWHAQGSVLFNGSTTTGPDGMATVTLALDDVPEADYGDYTGPSGLDLVATATDGSVVALQFDVAVESLGRGDEDGSSDDYLGYDEATLLADHAFAGPGAYPARAFLSAPRARNRKLRCRSAAVQGRW